jgi:hypothetical protein
VITGTFAAGGCEVQEFSRIAQLSTSIENAVQLLLLLADCPVQENLICAMKHLLLLRKPAEITDDP